jgi:hypothetical protein
VAASFYHYEMLTAIFDIVDNSCINVIINYMPLVIVLVLEE